MGPEPQSYYPASPSDDTGQMFTGTTLWAAANFPQKAVADRPAMLTDGWGLSPAEANMSAAARSWSHVFTEYVKMREKLTTATRDDRVQTGTSILPSEPPEKAFWMRGDSRRS